MDLIIDAVKDRPAREMPLYDMMRPNMRTGDLVEFSGRSLLDATIQWRTGYDVNHTAIVLCMKTADFGAAEHVLILEATPFGVRLSRLSRRLESYRGSAFWVPLRSEWNSRRDVICAAAMSYEGRRYDYGSLARNLIGRVSAKADAMFCSELAFVALRDAGLPVGDGPVPVPGEISAMSIFKNSRRIL